MTRLPRLALIGCLAVANIVLPLRPAHATEEEDAARARGRKFFKRADKLFNLGRFDEALEEYQKAYEEFPAPEILFNIGQCHRNLGNYDEAIFSFQKYLKLKPDADNREAVESYVVELEAEKARNKDDEPPDEPDIVPPPPVVDEPSPFYTRWWFWTGAVVVLGGAAATYVILSQEDAVPDSDLPPLEWPK
jgi:tetratricopeptide (TPR) repeat protein